MIWLLDRCAVITGALPSAVGNSVTIFCPSFPPKCVGNASSQYSPKLLVTRCIPVSLGCTLRRIHITDDFYSYTYHHATIPDNFPGHVSSPCVNSPLPYSFSLELTGDRRKNTCCNLGAFRPGSGTCACSAEKVLTYPCSNDTGPRTKNATIKITCCGNNIVILAGHKSSERTHNRITSSTNYRSRSWMHYVSTQCEGAAHNQSLTCRCSDTGQGNVLSLEKSPTNMGDN